MPTDDEIVIEEDEIAYGDDLDKVAEKMPSKKQYNNSEKQDIEP